MLGTANPMPISHLNRRSAGQQKERAFKMQVMTHGSPVAKGGGWEGKDRAPAAEGRASAVVCIQACTHASALEECSTAEHAPNGIHVRATMHAAVQTSCKHMVTSLQHA